MGLPLVVSEYRERKILKRFKVTPVNPVKLLVGVYNLCHILRGIHAHFVPICYAVLENKDTWFFAFIFGKLVADYGIYVKHWSVSRRYC